MKTTKNTGKNQNSNRKIREVFFRSHLNHKHISENLFRNPLNNFLKQTGTINTTIMFE